MDEEKNYYVYALIDPRNGQPFYIGKGKMIDGLNRKYRRIKEHLDCVDKQNPFKTRIVEKLKRAGTPAGYEIICEHLNEVESFDKEKELIERYGKRINNTGILVNMTDGGEGSSGHLWTEDQKANRSVTAKAWHKNNKNPFEGKTHTELTRKIISNKNKKYLETHPNNMLGKHHSDETKELLRNKMKQRGCTVPKDQWHIFGSPAEKNSQAKKFIFISPDGIHTEVIGRFKEFIKENKLSLDVFKAMCDKGAIPEPKNKNHNRMTQERLNSIGWEVRRFK